MARNDGRSFNSSMFVAGTLDAFVKHQALQTLSSSSQSINRLTDDMQSKIEGITGKRWIPTAVIAITDALERGANPLTDPSIQEQFDFNHKLHYYESSRPEDSYDFDRAIEIAKADTTPELAAFRSALEESPRAQSIELMGDYLGRSVNAEINAQISSVALSSCLASKDITLDTVMDKFHTMVTEPLNESVEFQNKIGAKLAALHSVKQDILTDFNNVEFLQKHGQTLVNSDLSPHSLQTLTNAISTAGDKVPSALESLQVASLEHLDNPAVSGVNLPRSEMQLAGVLSREDIPFNSDGFQTEVSMLKSDMSTMSLDSLVAVTQKTIETTREPQSLSELLSQQLPMDSSPSM